MSYDPMAPASMPHPMRALAGMVPCKSCGRPIDPATAEYSEEGELTCPTCRASEQVAIGERRALSTLKSAAFTACTAGVVSLLFNPFFILSFVAVSGGVGVLTTLKRTPDFREKLGGQYASVVAAAWAAIVTGLVRPALLVLLLFAAAALAR